MKKKYNVFCEVRITNIILIILGTIICTVPLFTKLKFDTTILIILILLILIFVKDLRKYLNIKKYGIEVKDANFKIVTLNNNKKMLKIHFNYKNKNYDLMGKITFNGKVQEGKTDVIFNKKDPNEFYAFGPNN